MMGNMKSGLVALFRQKVLGEGPLHPVDRRLAKEWIKKRLISIFPELRWDSAALERTYEELNLEMLREHVSNVEPEPLFEMRINGQDLDSRL